MKTCIVCSKKFPTKEDNKKGKHLPIRRTNCKTCSPECSKVYNRNSLERKNKPYGCLKLG